MPLQRIGEILCHGFSVGNSTGACRVRLKLILATLNAATGPGDMALSGLKLHPLKGDLKGRWAVEVSGDWRVTFGFVGTDADEVDYEDYH